MDRLDEILSALSRIEQNTTHSSQQTHIPNNYVPHYTKAWTNSDLAKVGAYSTKQSESQKTYNQCSAIQDKAWATAMKNELKWKK